MLRRKTRKKNGVKRDSTVYLSFSVAFVELKTFRKSLDRNKSEKYM